MSSSSRHRTLLLATALLALALTAPSVHAAPAGNTSAQPSAPNFPTAIPTRPGALTQAPDTQAAASRRTLPGPPTWPTNPQPIAPARAVNAPTSGGGLNWTTIGLGIVGSLLVIAGLVALAHHNRSQRTRVTGY